MTNVKEKYSSSEVWEIWKKSSAKNTFDRSLPEPEIDARRELANGKRKYYPHEVIITVTLIAACVLATLVALNYYNKISFNNPNLIRISFLAGSATLFAFSTLLTWYVCAKLSTLNSQYGWYINKKDGDTLDTNSSTLK